MEKTSKLIDQLTDKYIEIRRNRKALDNFFYRLRQADEYITTTFLDYILTKVSPMEIAEYQERSRND